MRTINRLFQVVTVLFLTVVVSQGQITNVTDDQSAPIPGAGHDYIKMLSETVNPANGSVSIRIHLPVPMGRKLTLPFSITYNSSGVDHVYDSLAGYGAWTSNQAVLSQGGWSYALPMLSSISMTRTGPKPGGGNYVCNFYTDYMFQDTGSGRHALGLSYLFPGNNNDCQNISNPPTAWYTSKPGSDNVYYASMPGVSPITVVDPGGTVYSFPNAGAAAAGNIVGGGTLPTLVEDRNGNQLTVTALAHGGFNVIDTLGHGQGATPPAVAASSFGNAAGDTISVSGLSGNYTVYWGTANVNMPRPNVVHVAGTYCTAISGYVTTHPVITSIVLPNGQSYQFQYDSTYGLLSKVIYPTGGYVRYVWGTNPLAEFASFSDSLLNANGCQYEYDSMAVAQRFVSFDGQTEALEQDFSYMTNWDTSGRAWTTKQTTVTSNDHVRGTTLDITSYTYNPGSFTAPPNDLSMFAGQVPLEQTINYEDGNGTALRTVNKAWVLLFPDELACESTAQNGFTSRIDYTYGGGAQVTDKKEWDWGQAPACGTSASGTPIRETQTAYQNFASDPNHPYAGFIFDRPSSIVTYGSGTRSAETDFAYDQTGVTSVSGLTGHDETNYGSGFNTRGNATTKTQWLNTGTSPVTKYTYDEAGQVLSMTDPCGNGTCSDMTGSSHTTIYSHLDSPNNNGCLVSGSAPGQTDAYLTQVTRPTTGSVNHIEKFTYCYEDGQLNSSTDENNQVTSYFYGENNERLDRLTGINYPDCVAAQMCSSTVHSVSYAYNDAPPSPSVTVTKLGNPDPNYVTEAVMDGVGHVTRNIVVSDSDYTDTTYDALGRVYTVSNPYRSTSEPTYGLTTYTYDGLGRTTNVNYPDGNNTVTTYPGGANSGNCANVKDPQGHSRTTCNDGLGRLTAVTEGGFNYQTTYGYNALDDLLTVAQGAQQGNGCSGSSRRFVYDSLSRMTSACNAESGTVNYVYDANGNLTTRTDARNITTTYAYDTLNRLTSKTYNDTPRTPTASFFYDETNPTVNRLALNLTNTTGRLSHTQTSAGNAFQFYTYDSMGRISGYGQCSPLCAAASYGYFWQGNYTFDLAGGINSVYIPGMWVPTPYQVQLNRQLDGGQHVTSITAANFSDSTHPANLANITWTAFGAINTLQNGCSDSGCGTSHQTLESYFYNKRLQPATIELGNSTANGAAANSCWVYNYSTVAKNPTACTTTPLDTTGDNGNVMGYSYFDYATQQDSHMATFGYDAVNRLDSAQSMGFGALGYNLSFTYDAFGNMDCTISRGTLFCPNFSYGSNSNRITTSGYNFDASGNLTSDGTYSYTYDAEGRLATMNGMNLSFNAVYYADGTEAEGASNGGWTQDYVYDAYDPGGQYVLEPWGNVSGGYDAFELVGLGGRHIAIYNENNPRGTYFVHPNALGSNSNTTDWKGATNGEQIYAPWGQQLVSGGQAIRFAGMSHRDQTGFDVTPNRDYSNTLGRWLTPDPGGLKVVTLADPQTWNMYAYVRNNPTTLTDQTGLCTDKTTGRDTGKGWFWCAAHFLGLVETQAEQTQEARNFFNNNVVVDQNGNRVDPGRLSDAEVRQAFRDFSKEWRAVAEQGADPTKVLSSAAPVMTSWGWSGSPSYIKARNELTQPGSHETLNGKVPTRAEATEMIQESGGKIDRSEQAHGPDSVSTHDYPHINYTTENGLKATVKVQD